MGWPLARAQFPRITALCFLAVYVAPSTTADLAVQTADGSSAYGWSEYQNDILQQLKPIWPEKFHHIYKHYNESFIEERFFNAWRAANAPLPQIYLPIGWSTYFWSHRRCDPQNHTLANQANDRVRALFESLDRTRSYFTITHFAELMVEEGIVVPCDLKLTLFSAGGPMDRATNPHLNVVAIPLLLEILEPGQGPRTRHVTFAGGFAKWQDWRSIRSMLRQKLGELPGFNITRKVQHWKELIQDSEFHLCPRGYGPTSYRLYECLQAETIPIYVWAKDAWMAFSDQLDWSTISIMLHFSKIDQLPRLVNQTNIEQMRANIRATRHMWTYQYTIDYITGRIANTSDDPGLNEYRLHGDNCTSEQGRNEHYYQEYLRGSATPSLLGAIWRSVEGAGGPTQTAQQPVTGVSFVVFVAALALLWHRRMFLRRKCREIRYGRDATSRDHNGQHHGKEHAVVSGPDTRLLLSRKQSA